MFEREFITGAKVDQTQLRILAEGLAKDYFPSGHYVAQGADGEYRVYADGRLVMRVGVSPMGVNTKLTIGMDGHVGTVVNRFFENITIDQLEGRLGIGSRGDVAPGASQSSSSEPHFLEPVTFTLTRFLEWFEIEDLVNRLPEELGVEAVDTENQGHNIDEVEVHDIWVGNKRIARVRVPLEVEGKNVESTLTVEVTDEFVRMSQLRDKFSAEMPERCVDLLNEVAAERICEQVPVVSFLVVAQPPLAEPARLNAAASGTPNAVAQASVRAAQAVPSGEFFSFHHFHLASPALSDDDHRSRTATMFRNILFSRGPKYYESNTSKPESVGCVSIGTFVPGGGVNPIKLAEVTFHLGSRHNEIISMKYGVTAAGEAYLRSDFGTPDAIKRWIERGVFRTGDISRIEDTTSVQNVCATASASPQPVAQPAADALKGTASFYLTRKKMVYAEAQDAFIAEFVKLFRLDEIDGYSMHNEGGIYHFTSRTFEELAIVVVNLFSDSTMISIELSGLGYSKLPPESNSQAIIQRTLEEALDKALVAQDTTKTPGARASTPPVSVGSPRAFPLSGRESAFVQECVAWEAAPYMPAIRGKGRYAFPQTSRDPLSATGRTEAQSPAPQQKPSTKYSFVYTDPGNPIRGVKSEQLEAFLGSSKDLFGESAVSATIERGRCSFATLNYSLVLPDRTELIHAQTNDTNGTITVTVDLGRLPPRDGQTPKKEDVRDRLIDALDAALTTKQATLASADARKGPDLGKGWVTPPGKERVQGRPLPSERIGTFSLGENDTVRKVWRPIRRR